MDAMNLKRKIAMLEAENKQLKERGDLQGGADNFKRAGGAGAVTNDDRNWMSAFGGGGGPT